MAMSEEETKETIKETQQTQQIKSKKNPWIISTIILGIVVLVLLFFVLKGTITGSVISEEKAGKAVVDWANSQTGGGVELIKVEEEYGLYKVIVSYKSQSIPLYVTKDGKTLVQGVLSLDSESNEKSQSQNENPQAPKSDKPKVELFVMSYCPYGTQAEKGIIPVFELLKDKIDSSIRFVHYVMHGDKETQENFRQICIREEQSDKFLNYLKCFLEDANYSKCLTEAGINTVSLEDCIENRVEDYYKVDSDLSQGYGVRGSPTLVINGQIISSGRSSSAFLDTICSGFNDTPEECSEELSSNTPSPGFGYKYSTSGSATASCG